MAGQFERAEAEARAAVDVLQSSTRIDQLAIANALDDLVAALVLNGRAGDAETLSLARRNLEERARAVRDEDASLIPALVNLVDVLTGHGEFDQAIALAHRAVRIAERYDNRDGAELAVALDRLGRACSSARRLDEALDALSRSLELKERRLPAADIEIARTLEDITLVLHRRGEYGRAAETLRRAIAIQEAISTNHPAYATTLNLLAQQFWFDGDLTGSREASERAVSVAERSLRPDHPTTALSLRFLAATLTDLGDLTGSLEMTERALAIAERNFGPASHVTAEYVSDLGIVELDLGNYEAARTLLRRALSIYEARYGESNDLVASTLNGLARANARLGDYAAASREQSRAIAIFTRTGGPNHPFVALSLSRMATVYNDEGRPRQALPLLQRALAIRETNLGPDHRDVARTLADLAATLAAVGQPARAQLLATRALRILERVDAPDAPELATVLALYAKLQTDRGDAAAAREYYERALVIRGKAFGPAHPLYAETQTGLATTLAALGDSSGALTTASAAETSGRDHLHLMLRSLPERQALQYAAARPRGLNLILSIAATTPEAATVAVDGLIRSRALVLDEIAARQSAGRASGGALDPARVALSSAQQRLANLLVRGPGSMPAAQYAALIDAARRDSEAAEQVLAEQSAEFRAARGRSQAGVDDVLSALPPDSALVSFIRYDRTRLVTPSPNVRVAATPRAPPRPVPSYLAFVLRPDQPPAVVDVGAATAIDALVSQWRADIAAEAFASSTSPAAPAASARTSGVALRQRVWDRLAPHLQGVGRVLIVPDGALSLVPFAALPVGQRSFLLERGPVIHYLSAERDLVSSPSASESARGLLAVGGPSFNDRTLFRARPRPTPTMTTTSPAPRLRGVAGPCRGLGAISFTPLEGTRQEVRDLSGVWTANATSDSEPAHVLIGRDASETAVKRHAPGRRVLHLATHGFFLNGDCTTRPIGTRGVGGLVAAGRQNAAENPLLISGLALAGANRRASAGPDEDDGILTAEEVASVDLSGVEWAVLSACDTGVGEIRAGEGVFGLRRAFQVAGARTVVMSLWSVDDQATRAWMRALYEGRFQRKLSTADAVHEASLSTLRDRRAKGLSTHPFYWAAFVAAGDWR